MVDLNRELQRREKERQSKARAIWSNRLAIAIMVVCLGLCNFFFGKAYDLSIAGSTQRVLVVLIQIISVAGQVALLGLLLWAHKVRKHGQQKL